MLYLLLLLLVRHTHTPTPASRQPQERARERAANDETDGFFQIDVCGCGYASVCVIVIRLRLGRSVDSIPNANTITHKKKTKAFSVLYFAFTFRSQTKSIESLNSSVGNLIVGAQCDWFARPAYPQRIHLVCTSIRWYATYDGCDAIIYTRLAVGKPMCLLWGQNGVREQCYILYTYLT